MPAQTTGDRQDATKPNRMASIDVYRGIVMFLMLAEVLELFKLVDTYPNSQIAQWLNFHTTHVAWSGCSLHDMIQPSFSFLVGVALPFSFASRIKRGDSKSSMFLHAVFRAMILVILGIALRSLGKSSTNFFFVDTLTQIGLGYVALFLLGQLSVRLQALVTAFILLSYWQLFALWPLPDLTFSWTAVGVPLDWPHHLDGFAGHWNKNMNPAWRFDTWFMNLFPQDPPYEYNSGGYCTLNFIPTLATMLLGSLAGRTLIASQATDSATQRNATSSPWLKLVLAGLGLAVSGYLLDGAGFCPIVKRIWTPSWVLFSGGLCFACLGVLSWICDVQKWQLWAWPLTIIGANSIVAYVMSWTLETPIKAFLVRHFGNEPFLSFGPAWEPILLGSAVLLTMWLVLLWLHRQRIFVRI